MHFYICKGFFLLPLHSLYHSQGALLQSLRPRRPKSCLKTSHPPGPASHRMRTVALLFSTGAPHQHGTGKRARQQRSDLQTVRLAPSATVLLQPRPAHSQQERWREQGPRAPTTCLALSPASFQMPLQEPPQDYAGSLGTRLRPLPRNVEGVADDPALHNPLQRMHRSADVHMPLHASPHPLPAHAAAPACSFLMSSCCCCLHISPPVHTSSTWHCCLLHQATHCSCSLVARVDLPYNVGAFALQDMPVREWCHHDLMQGGTWVCLQAQRIQPCLICLWLCRLGLVLARYSGPAASAFPKGRRVSLPACFLKSATWTWLQCHHLTSL